MEVQLLRTFYPSSYYAISCILLLRDWDLIVEKGIRLVSDKTQGYLARAAKRDR